MTTHKESPNLYPVNSVDLLIVEEESCTVAKMESDFNVTSVTGEDAALEALNETSPGAVLISFQLEQGSALSLCRKIKQNLATTQIPVILVAKELTATLKNYGIEAGAKDVIPASNSKELIAMQIIEEILSAEKLVSHHAAARVCS